MKEKENRYWIQATILRRFGNSVTTDVLQNSTVFKWQSTIR